MLTYEEAKDLYERQYQYVNELLWDKYKIKDFVFVQVRIAHELYKKLDFETENAIISLNHLKYELLSYPEIYNRVRYWLVMIIGGSNEVAHVMQVKHITQEDGNIDIEQGMTEVGGRIRTKALELVDDNNFKLLGNSVGKGTWSILCHCTNEEATLLCNMTREAFPEEINNDYIKLKRMIGFIQF